MGKHYSKVNTAAVSEGLEVANYIAAVMEDDSIVCDELTAGRIRTIYVQLKYKQKTSREIADYYDLPIDLIRDIGHGKAARKITRDLDE